MTNKTTRRGNTQENKKVVIKQDIIEPRPSLLGRALKSFSSGSNQTVSGSSTHAVTQVPGELQALKTLKQVQGLSNFIIIRGFTLIELLVVVLIIGILAAVALPQYNKAVEKARAVEGLVNISNLEKAIDAWVLVNGYPTSRTRLIGCPDKPENKCNVLDIDLERVLTCDERGYCHSKDFEYGAWCSETSCNISAYNSNLGYELSEYRAADGQISKYCYYYSSAEFLCKGLEAKGWIASDD